MLKVNSFSAKGTKLGSVNLPKDLGEEGNIRLLAQAIRVYEDRAHKALAKAKTRAEVERTKKKLYKQKGTGGARHGSRSAPIFVGGGAAHGPRPIKRELSLPARMEKKALKAALALKAKNGEVVVIKGLSKVSKTKQVENLLAKLGFVSKRVTFVLAEKEDSVIRATRNLENSRTELFKNLNAYKVFFGGMLVFDGQVLGRKETKK